MDHAHTIAAFLLGACGLVSSGLLVLSSRTHRILNLPELSSDSVVRDPFEVTKQDDIVDGEPINVEKYYLKVCVTW